METTLFVWIWDGLTSIIKGLKALELLMVNVFAFFAKTRKNEDLSRTIIRKQKEIRNFGRREAIIEMLFLYSKIVAWISRFDKVLETLYWPGNSQPKFM